MKLTVIQDTFFKQYTQDSSRLKPSDRVEVLAGQSFEIHSWKTAGRSHYKVALIDETLGDPARNTWYVYSPHVRLLNSQDKPPTFDPKPSTSFPGNLPRTKLLNVPHKGQLDNALNPKGACNVTCFAMAMTYFQLPGKTNAVQLEDELYRYMTANRLSRHEPEDLAKMAKAYGLRSDFTTRGTLQDMRRAISLGQPCIIHGYFTSFGHIILVKGYDERGFIVNDPFGEWTSKGYRKGNFGDGLHYSNNLIQSKCSPEGKDYLWLHRLAVAPAQMG
jgi:uncharacterized protein YvpB